MCPIKKTHFFHITSAYNFFVCSAVQLYICPFIMWEHNAVYIFIQITCIAINIINIFSAVFSKPQDSFSKRDKTLSWSAESAAHRQKTLINLPALVLNDMFSCNNVKWLNIAMNITHGRVFRGTPNILIFGLFFLKIKAIWSEQWTGHL